LVFAIVISAFHVRSDPPGTLRYLKFPKEWLRTTNHDHNGSYLMSRIKSLKHKRFFNFSWVA
ncbi:MAG: hypothetical protein JWO91_3615, partial [Acidobacteriaceae bacterium]|nr:hypothetical protein [Acidobacteriaceae bacterium]